MAMLKLNNGLNFGIRGKFGFAIRGGGRFSRFVGMRRDERHGICLNCCSGIENGRVITMGENDYYYGSSKIASVSDSTATCDTDCYYSSPKIASITDSSKDGDNDEGEEFVRMMREAQPHFLAHRGRTFVVVLSAEIIDSPYMSSILKVCLLSFCLCFCVYDYEDLNLSTRI